MNKVTNSIKKRIKKLSALVSAHQRLPDVNYIQVEHVDSEGNKTGKTSRKLGVCRKDMELFLTEEYEAGRIDKDMLDLFISMNRS
jgi:hypothetical protein